VIGVPSSAGAHAPGVERGAHHVREAGLLPALAAAGIDAVDGGDLPTAAFGTAPAPSGARNRDAVLEVVRRVAGAVVDARAAGEVPLLLGGDCTLTIGAVLGLRRLGHPADDVAVLYLDGDADLDVPAEGWGVLDSCGVAHLLGDEAADPQVAAPDGYRPLLDAAGLALLGFHPAQLSPGQWRRYAAHRLSGYPVTGIPAGRAGEVAGRALAPLRHRTALVAHLDVDIIDFAALPLADCPRYHGGLHLDDAMAAISQAAAHRSLACLTLTEINPDHDPTGALTRRLLTSWTRAVADGLGRRGTGNRVPA
jgi:arginase